MECSRVPAERRIVGLLLLLSSHLANLPLENMVIGDLHVGVAGEAGDDVVQPRTAIAGGQIGS